MTNLLHTCRLRVGHRINLGVVDSEIVYVNRPSGRVVTGARKPIGSYVPVNATCISHLKAFNDFFDHENDVTTYNGLSLYG